MLIIFLLFDKRETKVIDKTKTACLSNKKIRKVIAVTL